MKNTEVWRPPFAASSGNDSSSSGTTTPQEGLVSADGGTPQVRADASCNGSTPAANHTTPDEASPRASSARNTNGAVTALFMGRCHCAHFHGAAQVAPGMEAVPSYDFLPHYVSETRNPKPGTRNVHLATDPAANRTAHDEASPRASSSRNAIGAVAALFMGHWHCAHFHVNPKP